MITKRVAFVDDDMTFTSLTIKYLQQLTTGVEFVSFETGDELIELLKIGERFDMYLVDLVPKDGALDGLEVTDRILEYDPKAKIVGMSKVGDKKMVLSRKKSFRDVGALDFYNKFDDPEILADALRRLLN